MLCKKIVNALIRLKNADTNKTNSLIRTMLGLKVIRSSLPYGIGSRYADLTVAHKPFGFTALFTDKSINAITVHVNSSEYDEDIMTLNKELPTKISITIKKPKPIDYRIVCKREYVRKGKLIAKGPGKFNEIRANISGKLHINPQNITIKATQNIGTGTKLQCIYLQKHVLVKEVGRYKFVNVKEHPVTDNTIETLKSVKLKPKIIDMTEYGIKQPTLVSGTKSIFKRRASGYLAQLTLGLNKALELAKWKTENDWDKTVYVTKVYDEKNKKYLDVIVGIGCWLVSVTSNDYEYKIGSDQYDIIGRAINSASIDPFALKVLMYYNEELANAILDLQIQKRKEKLEEVMEKW